jgi:cellulose synthase/poly-beta-1,6-N-acetylglucosamine synthase-like glycosyltransferase
MNEGQVRFSIVVPAYNSAATMAECLAALNQQTVSREEYEVIVVDDGSTDATAEIASNLGAVVLRQANSGPAAARNTGIAGAHGDVVLFTDSDCMPVRGWIEQMIAPLQDHQIVGVKGVYRTRQRNWTARFIQVEYEDRYDHTARSKHVDFIDTYSAGYRRDVLLASGGFDTSFPYASVEDQELSFRLAEAGHQMVFVPEGIVYHYHPESWLRYARRKYKIGYWKTLVLHLHPSKVWGDTHTPGELKLQLILAAASAPLALLSLLIRPALWGLAGVMGLFGASTLPFLIKAWRKDRTVALLSLPVLYVRAWSLGLGLLAGYIGLWSKTGPLARATLER